VPRFYGRKFVVLRNFEVFARAPIWALLAKGQIGSEPFRNELCQCVCHQECRIRDSFKSP
jgi:hypothetical protein